MFWFLVTQFRDKGGIAALDLNNFNFFFLAAGLLLHWRPRSFLRAVTKSVPATAGVLIQFPFYGGIFGMISKTPIAAQLAHAFVSITTKIDVPDRRRDLLRDPRHVRSVRRRQVDRRSAVRDGRREAVGRAPRLDRADLQRRRGTPEPDQPLLDAAAHGHPQRPRARPGRILDPATAVSRADRVAVVLAVRADVSALSERVRSARS